MVVEISDRVVQKLASQKVGLSAHLAPHNPTPKPLPSKNSVSDRMWQKKAPMLIELLLRDNSLKLGCSITEAASTLKVSMDVVRRIVKRLSDTGLIQTVKNTGVGGKAAFYKISRGKAQQAQNLLEELRAQQETTPCP